MAARLSGEKPSASGSCVKKRTTIEWMVSASSIGSPIARQATLTESFPARSWTASHSPRSITSSRSSSNIFTAVGWRDRSCPGRNIFRTAFRSRVCSGGSITLSIGVTGWSFVRTCAGAVPCAVESRSLLERSQMSAKREIAQALYFGR